MLKCVFSQTNDNQNMFLGIVITAITVFIHEQAVMTPSGNAAYVDVIS